MYLCTYRPGPLRSSGQRYSGFQNRDTATNKIISSCKTVLPSLYNTCNKLGMQQNILTVILTFVIDFLNSLWSFILLLLIINITIIIIIVTKQIAVLLENIPNVLITQGEKQNLLAVSLERYKIILAHI